MTFMEIDLKEYSKTTLYLCRRHGVPYKEVRTGKLTPAFYNQPLDVLEFFLHDVAHVLSMGGEVSTLPKNLYDWIGQELKPFSAATQDAYERDAAAITYWAGKSLGLWGEEGLEPIADSCCRNHNNRMLSSDFERIFRPHVQDGLNKGRGKTLSQWFQEKREGYFSESKRSLAPFSEAAPSPSV